MPTGRNVKCNKIKLVQLTKNLRIIEKTDGKCIEVAEEKKRKKTTFTEGQQHKIEENIIKSSKLFKAGADRKKC